ncbi:MAG: hypothetical protein L0154_17115 [Chloroflexi bacterium]|nr:hypothetical protein [Chloroflexota bacterium]
MNNQLDNTNGRIPILRLILHAFVAALFSLFLLWFLVTVVGQWIPSIPDTLLKPVTDEFDQTYDECIATNPDNIIGCLFTATLLSLIVGGIYITTLYTIFAAFVAGILTFVTVKKRRVINIFITVLISLPIALLVLTVITTIEDRF